MRLRSSWALQGTIEVRSVGDDGEERTVQDYEADDGDEAPGDGDDDGEDGVDDGEVVTACKSWS